MAAEDRNGKVSTQAECTGCSPRESSFDELAKRQARAHPIVHPLPLVATSSMTYKAVQTDFHEKALSVKADVAAAVLLCLVPARRPLGALPFALSSFPRCGPGA
jgi:hypothetical protein